MAVVFPASNKGMGNVRSLAVSDTNLAVVEQELYLWVHMFGSTNDTFNLHSAVSAEQTETILTLAGH